MKNLIALCILVSILLAGCGKTPAECTAYCERITQWASQCKKPEFSMKSCNRHFQTGESDREQGERALRCWQISLRWAPDMKVEFDCTKTEVPEL